MNKKNSVSHRAPAGLLCRCVCWRHPLTTLTAPICDLYDTPGEGVASSRCYAQRLAYTLPVVFHSTGCRG